ncbi:MAG TPA: glycosyltransferase family 9 protein [Opitutaceae bacterium]
MPASAPSPAVPPSPGPPRILIIRRRYLGDLVLLGSLLRNLRLHWPQAHLAVLAERAYAPVLALNPDVDAAPVLPAGAFEWPGFVRRLRAGRFTHVIDVDNTEKTALVSVLSGARVRVAYDREGNRVRSRWAYSHFVPVSNEAYHTQHITETYLALLQPLGVPVRTREVRLTPRGQDLATLRALVGPPRADATRRRRLLIHPGSRSAYRMWPAERFAAVADRLQDAHDVQVFLVAGAGEAGIARQISEHAKAHLVAIDRKLSIGEFAALLSEFDLMLCHDSGPMHIAAAVGTPVVALYGSQHTAIWHPLGERHTVLQPPLPCRCLGADAPGPCVPGDSYRSYCVRKLSVDTVYDAVQHALRGCA